MATLLRTRAIVDISQFDERAEVNTARTNLQRVSHLRELALRPTFEVELEDLRRLASMRERSIPRREPSSLPLCKRLMVIAVLLRARRAVKSRDVV
jgi:hypothetical protein